MAFDFPSSPSEGQIYNAPSGPTYVFQSPTWRAVGQGQIAIISDTAPANPANGTLWYESDTGILFIWMNDGNSSQWVQVGGIQAGGAIVQTVITTSGTYTKPAGLRYLEVTCVGGGGGSTRGVGTGAGQASAGGGGAGGATGIKLYNATDLAASTTMTIGAGGTSPGGIGGNAGSTTFAGLSAGGGNGPGGSLPTATSALGIQTLRTLGGVASGGDINIDGEGSSYGWANPHGRAGIGIGGDGGPSFFAPTRYAVLTTTTTDGAAGWSPGGGASGGATGPSISVAPLGGVGAAGCIILKEYF